MEHTDKSDWLGFASIFGLVIFIPMLGVAIKSLFYGIHHSFGFWITVSVLGVVVGVSIWKGINLDGYDFLKPVAFMAILPLWVTIGYMCFDKSYIPDKATNFINAEMPCYICTGSSSKVYHLDPHCRGLNSCSGDLKEVSIDYAKNIGRRPCKKCAF